MQTLEVLVFPSSTTPLLPLEPIRRLWKGVGLVFLVTRTCKGRPGHELVLAEGHNGMRNVSDVSARVPRFPPLPGVVEDFEEFSAKDGKLLVVAGGPRVGHLSHPGSSAELKRQVFN